LDVDHLAAVSTLVTQRRSLWRASLVGALWGLGHTAALLAASVVVIGLHAEIPPRLASALELGVAVMLVVLGLNLLRTVWTGRAPARGGARQPRSGSPPGLGARRPRLTRDVGGDNGDRVRVAGPRRGR